MKYVKCRRVEPSEGFHHSFIHLFILPSWMCPISASYFMYVQGGLTVPYRIVHFSSDLLFVSIASTLAEILMDCDRT